MKSIKDWELLFLKIDNRQACGGVQELNKCKLLRKRREDVNTPVKINRLFSKIYQWQQKIKFKSLYLTWEITEMSFLKNKTIILRHRKTADEY